MSADYELAIQAPDGTFLAPLPKVNRCAYSRVQNDQGEMTLTVPGDYYNLEMFAPFNRILVMRQIGGGTPYVDLDTPWFITDGPYEVLDANGVLTWVIGGTDALGLICNGTNIAYNDNNAYTYKLDEADDMIKAIVRENRGSLATDTNRDISGLMQVAPNNAAAPIIRAGSFARQQMMGVLQDLANASANDNTPTWLGFDIVLVSTSSPLLEFRTYVGQRGIDHRVSSGLAPLLLDSETGGLTNIKVGVSYKDAASYIYAGGPAIQDVRSVATDENDTMLARSPLARIEKYVDGTQLTDATALATLARSELRKARPKRTFTADLVETRNALRGVHWDFGDYLTAAWRTQTYDVRVDKIAVVLEANNKGGLVENSSVQLVGEESTSG